MNSRLRIGRAGWSIPRASARAFAGAGTHLERYAGRLHAVEINSSFYRPHAPATYERWAGCTPPGFSFAVKLPRELTHDARLTTLRPVDEFLAQIAGLGRKLGVVLAQLPPSLAFEQRVAARFFAGLRRRHGGAIACEPRHPSWFGADADALLVRHRIARVAADPACVLPAAEPGGWPGLVYYRLHGSPRTYWSPYERPYLDALAARLEEHARRASTWCVFDNTASGAATEDALYLVQATTPNELSPCSGRDPPS